MQNIEFHPIAEIFPLIHGQDFVELKADIKANGVIEPIWIYEGMILDGRNRFRACQEVGVIPEIKEYTGDSPASFVVSLNMRRRHLTASQKAAAAVEFLPWLESEAKARQAACLKQNSLDADTCTVKEKIPEREGAGQSRDKAAEMVGVNPRYVSDAKKIKEDSPEEFEKLKTGETSISQAKKRASQPESDDLEREPEAKEPPKSRGVGVRCAHEAIAVLKRIPLDDGLRQDAFNIVTDWIETNRG